MLIRVANKDDIDTLASYDNHIAKQELETIISLGRVYIAEENKEFIGWLRYNLFWNNTPFLNMLFLLEPYRGKGYGKQLLTYWEEQMDFEGYEHVMTSTASNEYAQHFYNKLGYMTIGGFIPNGEPYEILLQKVL